MLSITGSSYRLCDGVSRRDFLQIGGLGTAGLALPQLLQARAAAAGSAQPSANAGKAKGCILLFMMGGPPQMDTFDLKPDAPAEVRGELKPIATNVPGIQISESLPLLARHAEKLAIIRSVGFGYSGGAHGPGVYMALTGHHNPRVNADDIKPASDDFPCLGSAVARLRPGAEAMPPFVWLLDMYRSTFAGEGGGFLGKRYDPFRILQDPNRPEFRVQALAPLRDVPVARLGERRGLLEQLDRQAESWHHSGTGIAAHQERAFNLLLSPKAQQAFDLKAERAEVRDRYGRHKFGQAVLLARRLIEHGVPLVTVFWHGEEAVNQGWDLHYDSYNKLRKLMPPLDRAYSTLLEDLTERGLLDETLVVWTGEFGRAPRIEEKGGRGHWGRCYSVALAGGGIRGGQVHGRSDRHAAYPAENPVDPADLVATIYHHLGIDPATELTDPQGRPLRLCQGEVIRGLTG